MTLLEAKLNTPCVIKQINIADEKTKLRLMELGLNIGCTVKVKHKSLLKKTLLVIFNDSCFTLKDDIAKVIEAQYV